MLSMILTIVALIIVAIALEKPWIYYSQRDII